MSQMPLIIPHGGELIDRLISARDEAEWREKASTLVALTLDAREIADLELIATGAASPLKGFLNRDDYASVLERMCLSNGTVWPLPLSLAIGETHYEQLKIGGSAALYDETGHLWGVIDIEDIYTRDNAAEARWTYGTESIEHPGVAYLNGRPNRLIGGTVHVFPLPSDLPFAAYRYTPKQMREKISSLGWHKVAGFQTRNPIHRAHEYLTKLALEFTDGLIIHPLVGETKNDDVPANVRFKAYEVLIENYYPKERTMLAAFPAAMRYAGPREALFHALVRKNYGVTHFIVGRDHAGVGKFYGPYDAQALFDRFTSEQLGVVPLKFDATFYCNACRNFSSARACPHDVKDRLELSGTKVREILRSGGSLPSEFTRPEVGEILRAHYGTTKSVTAAAQKSPAFILWFTGLSGAGKSTLATAVKEQLSGICQFEILDGDEIRTHLSKGLGFSREDRDINIRRIGYVARLLARNGTAVITAAISPYAATRDEVRELAEKDGVTFIEVFAQASLDALIERDVKGLYKKAIAREIEHFTGVSDPYEAPTHPDIVVHTDSESVKTSVDKILNELRVRKLLNTGLEKAR